MFHAHEERKRQLTFAFSLRPDLTGDLTIAKPDWEVYCHKVGELIIQEQTPKRVMEVRTKLYELLAHCIPPTVIIKVEGFSPYTQAHVLLTGIPQTIADWVVDNVDESLKADIMHWAAIYVGFLFQTLNTSSDRFC